MKSGRTITNFRVLAFFYLVDQIVENGRGTLSPLRLPPVVQRGRLLEIELQGLPVHIDDEAWPEQDSQSLSSPIEITARIKGEPLAFLGRSRTTLLEAVP